MTGMANALRFTPRRPLAIVLVVFAAIMMVMVGLALWNPWRLTILYPLSHRDVAVGVLVLAGAFVSATAVLTVADQGRRALVALIGCLIAVPAFCIGLPVIALGSAFHAAPTSGTVTMASSPDREFVVVKSTFDTDAGPRTRLYVRTDSLFFGREGSVPLAECDTDPFSHGVPPETVRFTGPNTVAVPSPDNDTVVVHFDPDTLVPERTVNMCGPAA